MTDPIARIDALTRNARSTWFVLLSVLLFVGVTLMGVKHIDFYGVDRATQLPLVNVSVPTPLFFYAAPLLTAAVYGYFHLYLIRLWDALGEAPARINGTRLGDAVAPWLVIDAALYQRMRKRKDNCTSPRAMEGPATLLNLLLAWGFGLIILALLWWQSMTARSLWMTSFAALALIISTWTGTVSWVVMRRRMGGAAANHPVKRWVQFSGGLVLSTFSLFVAVVSSERSSLTFGILKPLEQTERRLIDRTGLSKILPQRPFDFNEAFPAQLTWSSILFGLAPLELRSEALVEKPADWQPHAIARDEFYAIWCRRNAATCVTPKVRDLPGQPGNLDPDSLPEPDRPTRPEAFDAEWQTRRATAYAALRKPYWSGADTARPDLRGAMLSDTFLTGANLREVQMQGANLFGAQLEGTDLYKARMQRTVLTAAQMQGANLWRAQMQGAVFFRAQMQGANLLSAQMQWADLSAAQLRGASLSLAEMEGARLGGAHMEGADLSGAEMQGADLGGAQMRGADLWKAQMKEANLSAAQMIGAMMDEAQMKGALLNRALISGTEDRPLWPQNTNFSASQNEGGALRFIDLSTTIFDDRANWRNVFLDASVTLPHPIPAAFGDLCQLEWAGPEPLTDGAFYAHWRGWLAINQTGSDDHWVTLNSVPKEWRDVEPVFPPDDCQWKTGPLSD